MLIGEWIPAYAGKTKTLKVTLSTSVWYQALDIYSIIQDNFYNRAYYGRTSQ